MKLKCGSVEGWDNYRHLLLLSFAVGIRMLLGPRSCMTFCRDEGIAKCGLLFTEIDQMQALISASPGSLWLPIACTEDTESLSFWL